MSPPPNPGARPPQPHSRPTLNSRPPPSPALDGSGSDPSLLPLFRAVDKDGEYHLLTFFLQGGNFTSNLLTLIQGLAISLKGSSLPR